MQQQKNIWKIVGENPVETFFTIDFMHLIEWNEQEEFCFQNFSHKKNVMKRKGSKFCDNWKSELNLWDGVWWCAVIER